VSVRHALALLVVVLALGAAPACHKRSGPVNMVAPVSAPSAWDSVLKEHTRRSQSYVIPSLEVDMRATLVTPRLRSAYIAARERFHGQVGEDLADELGGLGKKPDEGVDGKMMSGPDSEQYVLVFVAIFVRDARYRDLSVTSSIWDVKLSRATAAVAPDRVERMRVDPALTGVFPYVDRFDQAYLVRFPLIDMTTGAAMLSPGGAPVKLTVASALGTVSTEWTLQGDGVAPLDERAPEGTTESGALPDKKAKPSVERESAAPPTTDGTTTTESASSPAEAISER
jgi:hypothetical protein